MGNFSKSPGTVLSTNQSKGYVGMHIEREIPVLDRDLNLLHDMVAAALLSLIQKCIGDAAIGSGFAIQASSVANSFQIAAGTVSVGGRDVILATTINYTDQPGVPALTTPTAVRTDIVYLDVSLSDVDATTDSELGNSGDVGVQTSVRQKLNRVVRVAENSTAVPAPASGHSHFALARFNRTAGAAVIQAGMIVDLRKQVIPLVDLSTTVRALARPVFLAPPSEFTPTSGSGGISVTLRGRNFNIGTLRVKFVLGDSSFIAGISSRTATQAVVSVPVSPAGGYRILLENENGSDTSDDIFTVTSTTGGAPAFAAPGAQLTPTLGGTGTQVTIFGTGFTSSMQLSFFYVSGGGFDEGTPLFFQLQTSGQLVTTMPATADGEIKFRIKVGLSVVESTDIFLFAGGLPTA
jgi:IPT/TIG domain